MVAFMGIDPGKSGAIAVVGSSEVTNHICLKKLDSTEADISSYVSSMSGVAFCVLEKVGAMPKQGLSSTFKFGQSYGFLRGLLTAHKIPFEEITPQKWQKAMGCLSGGDKNVTKQKAGQLFPQVKVCHWNADALLIAEFCRRTWNLRDGRG